MTIKDNWGAPCGPVMARNRPILIWSAIFWTLVLLALPVSANHCERVEGELLAPWSALPPPGGLRDALEAAHVVVVLPDPPEGGTYRVSTSIEGETCYRTVCYELPDLRVAWYDANDTLLLDDGGDWHAPSGTVPNGTAYGLVYFRTLPYPSTPVPYPLPVDAIVCQ